MPYKLQFDVPDNIMKILQGDDGLRSGYAGLDEPIFIAGYPNASDQQILRNGLNAIYKSGGVGAAKREQERLLRMYGIYFPLASEGGGDFQTAHFKPKGKTLFERIKQKQFFNPKDIKPVFPENPPSQLDPKTGMHPNYGKQSKRYRKLDPMSANAMPPTGDPETDAIVDQQRTKERPSQRISQYETSFISRYCSF